MMPLTLYPGIPDDADRCGMICYEAFKSIAEHHQFPADFPSPAVAAANFTRWLSHPGYYVVAAALLGAVASGVICAGMSPEMVRAAWGRPQWMASDRSAWQPRDIWHYAGRQSHADLMGGQTGGAQPLREWTVSFTHGGVVGWTE